MERRKGSAREAPRRDARGAELGSERMIGQEADDARIQGQGAAAHGIRSAERSWVVRG